MLVSNPSRWSFEENNYRIKLRVVQLIYSSRGDVQNSMLISLNDFIDGSELDDAFAFFGSGVRVVHIIPRWFIPVSVISNRFKYTFIK